MSRPDLVAGRVSPARLAEGNGGTRPATSNEPFSSGLKKPDQKPISVDEAIKESFPASDPPSFNGGTETDPAPKPAGAANDGGGAAQNPRADGEADAALHRGGAGNIPIE